jgi:NADH dehydrogenase [ubiquinone] 1 alpha subcomplex assembly factor 6
MQKNKLSYCGDLVRIHDPDKFLLSLFAPAHAREALWTLFAFNYEISKTRDVVSQSTLGLIRLQWWRDEIGKIYDKQFVPAHEVLLPLAEVIRQYSLPREYFETLIYAREFDLEDVLPGNLEGMMNYADFTTTPLFKLAVQIMGDDPDLLPVQAVAINYGLSAILRAVLHHARQSRAYLPEELLGVAGVSREDLYNFEKGEALQPVIKAIALAQAKGIRPENTFLRAADCLAGQYFMQIKGLKYNIFSRKWLLPPAFKVLRLWLCLKLR